ncbi:20226_t:CDS:2, partial [Gigaspora rosea]
REDFDSRRGKVKCRNREKHAEESNEQRAKRKLQNVSNMRKKRAIESAEQQDERKCRNALTMREKRALEAKNASSILAQESSIQYQQLFAADQKLLHSFSNNMKKLHNNLCGVCNEQFPSIEIVKEEYEVPQELKGLNEIEEMLIIQVFMVVSVYNLHSGQYPYRGNIINFPQDVKNLQHVFHTTHLRWTY